MLRFYGEPALLLVPGLLALVLGFFVPVGQVFLYSVFVEAEGGRALGLDHFGRFFVDAYYLGVAGRTFRLSAIITLFCLLLGFPLAYLMARVSPRLRLWLIVLTILPMMTSVVIRTFGWLVLLGRGGLVADFLQAMGLVGPTFALLHTETGLVIAMVQVLLPFMALTLLGVISRIDPSLDEAARSLGGNFFQTLRHVVFPLSLPGVVSGSLLCFALSISSFITPTLVGGLRLPVLAMSIYQQAFSTLDWPFAAAQSVMLLAAVLFLMMPYTALMRRARRG